MRRAGVLCAGLAAAVLTGCSPPSPLRAAQVCEERAAAAQGPTGGVTIGANSRTGGFASARIGVTSDYLRGRDPLEVYDSCVYDLTGQPPVRPPRLRQ
ncbi:hypothetical protein OG2516_08062 [Oceanicola granulosus HTCC2516]|uniref:Lipoprotein n=1 Tax=Oceanicola granulosus (strain ATCC BAA-861 / DSM 15982 / KCTC 12143 / HTCC2516) TaxID=314256 RepID=Q2CI42_OCEGH|nr:hypothetical protein [Oceanicola granulosus]EAR52416.1 hypothetical protein OG2516_08062 [Oceanicola granulosus HTCC2516]